MRCGVHGGGAEGVPCGRRKPVSQSQIRQLFSWRHSRASPLPSSFGRDLRQQGPAERDSRVSGCFPSRGAEQGSVGEEASFPATSGPEPWRFSLLLVECHVSLLSTSPRAVRTSAAAPPSRRSERLLFCACRSCPRGAPGGWRLGWSGSSQWGQAATTWSGACGSRVARHECLVTSAQPPIHCHPAGSGEEAQSLWRPGCRG